MLAVYVITQRCSKVYDISVVHLYILSLNIVYIYLLQIDKLTPLLQNENYPEWGKELVSQVLQQ